MPQSKASQFLSTSMLLLMGIWACSWGIMAHVLCRLPHSAGDAPPHLVHKTCNGAESPSAGPKDQERTALHSPGSGKHSQGCGAPECRCPHWWKEQGLSPLKRACAQGKRSKAEGLGTQAHAWKTEDKVISKGRTGSRQGIPGDHRRILLPSTLMTFHALSYPGTERCLWHHGLCPWNVYV